MLSPSSVTEMPAIESSFQAAHMGAFAAKIESGGLVPTRFPAVPHAGSIARAFSGEVDPVHRRICVENKDESRFHVNGNGSRPGVAHRVPLGSPRPNGPNPAI